VSSEKALNHLVKVVQDNAGRTGGTRITLTLAQLRDIDARVSWLTDTVVGAAALHAGEITDESEAGYAAEELHEVASALVAEYPRLAGGYKGAKR
jgi:hypothetical protein